MAPLFLSIRSILLLGALWSSVSTEAVGSLGKRDALLSPRQSRCQNPAWIPACPGAFPCIPPGGICCSDGFTYVMPPRTCPDGTQPVATAVISNVVPTTAAPISTPPAVEYTWYTWTITYYYYYYYYTYFEATTELISTEKTYYTTVSLTATDEVQASSLFTSLSAALSYNVPTQAGTPTLGSASVTTSKPAIATSKPAITTYTTAPHSTSNVTVPSSTPPAPFTGAATSLHAGTASYFGSLFVLAAGAFITIPGLLMLWL